MLLLLAAAPVAAHPMGNFSVSHYARLEVTGQGIELVYALDLAEIPTFDLMRSWQLQRNSPLALLENKAREQAKWWLSQLQITSDLQPIHPRLLSSEIVISDGAGNLPVARITTRAHLDAPSGAIAYEDPNFPDRAGWKEIVIVAGARGILRQASQTGADVSKGLTEYPPDPTLAPPQDLRAQLTWSIEKPVLVASEPHVAARVSKPAIVPVPQPRRAPPATSPAAMTKAAAPPGSVVRGDFLSKLLHQTNITPWMMLVGFVAAFLLGGAHALTPGHGKTIVAAYLVGSRGTLKHAAFLGAMVTFTHTVSVFALGLATLFLFRFVMPEKIAQWLGVVSGLSIVTLGVWMALKRWRAASHHSHDHDHHHHHDHAHSHDHTHEHTHGDHAHHHHHEPAGHSHVPEEFSWTALMALGASGGLVPCESALVLLLGAIALGRVGLGLMLLLSFSAGLAMVLMAIGAIVLYAKNLLPERKRSTSGWVFRYVPVASAAILTVVGVVMTGISLGWIRPQWMIG
jgi:ABC-type nickel/cobalt efflux system permease component RcnA